MKYINFGSIGKNLTLLVILAVLPALATILYSGLEQRRHSIENAKRDVLFLTRTITEVQKDITNSTEIRTLFMSGYTADVIAHHGVIEEEVFYLQKPFSVKALAARVLEVLEQKKLNSYQINFNPFMLLHPLR